MLKFAILAVSLNLATVEPSVVSRTSANRYYDFAYQRELTTLGCTQSAVLQTARIEHDWRGRDWLVFLDSAGEEEGDCQLVSMGVVL